MTVTLLVGLIGYALLVSVALFFVYRRLALKPNALDQEVAALLKMGGTLADRTQLLTTIADIRSKEIRWHEKALSTLGIMALITTTLAAGVQTIRSAIEERESRELQGRIDDNRDRLDQADGLVESLSTEVRRKASRAIALNEDEKKIARYRLDRLSEMEKLEPTQVDELIDLSIALRDFSHAVRYIEKDRERFTNARPADQVALAEYYYFVDSLEKARDAANAAYQQRQHLPEIIHMRLLVMRVILDQTARDDTIAEIVNLMKVSPKQAETLLDGDLKAFSDGAVQMRANR